MQIYNARALCGLPAKTSGRDSSSRGAGVVFFVRKMNGARGKGGWRRAVDTCRGMATELKACSLRYREDVADHFKRA